MTHILAGGWLRVTNLHPHWWANPTWDVIRTAAIALALVATVRAFRCMRRDRNMPGRQVMRYGALQLFLLSACYSDVATLGNPATYKTLIDLAGVLFALAGTYPTGGRHTGAHVTSNAGSDLR